MVSHSLRPSGHDALTGALDRGSLRRWVESDLPRSLAAGRSLAMLYLDFDEFHLVNDRFGEAVGDLVLARWVSLLSRGLGPEDLLARVDGNELVVVIDRDRAPDLEKILCTMRHDVREGLSLPDLTVEFSAGIVRIDRPIAFDALLVEGVVRMVRGRDSWRALFGKPASGPPPSSEWAEDRNRSRGLVERSAPSGRASMLH